MSRNDNWDRNRNRDWSMDRDSRDRDRDRDREQRNNSYNGSSRRRPPQQNTSWRHFNDERDRQQQCYGGRGHYRPHNSYGPRRPSNDNIYGRDFNEVKNTYTAASSSSSQEEHQTKQAAVSSNQQPKAPASTQLNKSEYTDVSKRDREPMEIEMMESPVKKEEPIEKKAKLDGGGEEDTRTNTKEINKETWSRVPLMDKIVSQLSPGMDFHITDDMIQLEEGTPMIKKNKWMEKKLAAAAKALESINEHVAEIREEIHEDSDYSDSDGIECDKMFTCDKYANDMYSPSELEAFVHALPFNIIFDAGFLVPGIHPDDEKHCYCPCAKHMRKWRETFNLCTPIGMDACTNFRKNSPDAFMAHLGAEYDKGGILHRAISFYLQSLYENYWGSVTAGVSHKGLHKRSTPGYEAGVSAEKKCYVKAMEHYRTEIERRDFLLATEQKRIESLAKVEEVSEERANDIKQLQAALDDLTIKHEEGKDEEGKDEVVKDEDLCVVKKQEKQVSEEEINFYRTPIRALIGDLKMSVTGPIVSGKDKVDIHTPAKVNLQELFDKWFEDGKSNDKNEKTFLFRELVVRNHNHTKKVLWPWNVKMDSELKEIIGNKNTLKDLTAIDEGGPTRAFISAFNDQMGELSVSIHVPTSWISEEKRTVMPEQKREIRVKLFENGSSCFVPVRDASFEIDMKAREYGILPCSQEAAKREIIEKAKKFYRAIGRIFIHIICNDEGDNTVSTISASLLPEMLRNVLLRDIHPASKSYTKRDVLVDVLGMGEKRTFEWIKQEQLMTFEHIGFDQEFLERFDSSVHKDILITRENFKEKFVSLYMLKTRDIAISSLKEGITLDGAMNIQKLLSMVPSKVVSTLLFSNPEYTAQEVINTLEPSYSEHEISDKDIAVIRQIQQRCFQAVLPQVIRELSDDPNSTFLADFLYFCTGSSYLPYTDANPNFRIYITFSAILDINHLPTANTCSNQLNIPVNAYLNEEGALSGKLLTSIEQSGNSFGFG